MLLEITHELFVSFDYHHGGGVVDAKTIILKAPTANHMKYTAKLKQGTMVAILDIQEKFSNQKGKKKASSDEGEMTGEEMTEQIRADVGEGWQLGIYYRNGYDHPNNWAVWGMVFDERLCDWRRSGINGMGEGETIIEALEDFQK